MPRRNDIHRILIIGSGPIIIGQACEFHFRNPGHQGAKGRRLRSHPGEFQSRDHHDRPRAGRKTYIETLSCEYLTEIIRIERPDALLSTVGGQTGLNLSVELAETGCWRSMAWN